MFSTITAPFGRTVTIQQFHSPRANYLVTGSGPNKKLLKFIPRCLFIFQKKFLEALSRGENLGSPEQGLGFYYSVSRR